MGIKLVAEVLDETQHVPLLERMTLAALAEWARDETGQCWPGRPEISRRLGRAPRTVDRVMASLIGRGLVEIVTPAAPGRTPVYRLNVRQQMAHERASPDGARSESTCATSGVNVRHFRPQRAPSGGAQNPQEPSVEPSPTRVPARASDPSRNGRAPRPAWLDEAIAVVAEHLAVVKPHKTYDPRDLAESITGFMSGKTVTKPLAFIRTCAAENPLQFEPTPSPPRYRREDHQ
ncbi:MAG: hypothetical protein ACRDRR_18260 [Pseudonocardiaceae bacterium]